MPAPSKLPDATLLGLAAQALAAVSIIAVVLSLGRAVQAPRVPGGDEPRFRFRAGRPR